MSPLHSTQGPGPKLPKAAEKLWISTLSQALLASAPAREHCG